MINVVTVGGGTGSYTLLSGIKNIKDISISAIVAMTDDGGSTGVLRDELGVLPPGDVRQCLVALSEQTDMVRKLMSYRFGEGSLSGHSFGNIFLAGLEKVTGSFIDGVEVASDILKVKGKVIPVLDRVAVLQAKRIDGTLLVGENAINHIDCEENCIESVQISEDANINEHAKKAIDYAHFIIIGPGNHFCSILPNLVISGVQDAFRTTRAKVMYVVNLTNKRGHTMGWKASDYVTSIEKTLGRKLDIIIINSTKPTQEQVEHYKLEEGDGVLVENDLLDDSRVVLAPLISHALTVPDPKDAIALARSFIRHDSKRLEEVVSRIIS